MAGFNSQIFRAQFPLFSQPENQSLIYFDNAATTQKPKCVIDAISHFYLHHNGNAQRASHRLARAATDMLGQTRELAAEFVGASSVDEVVFTQGATEALNLIAYGLAKRLKADDEILLTHGEHHANLLPWQRLSDLCGAKLQFFPEQNGIACIDQWEQVVGSRTQVITLSAASNVLGYCTDLSLIANIKQRFPDVIIVLDASQLACHQPLLAKQWGCDFLVCSAHKFYGPTGVGLLYGKKDILHSLDPLLLGGEMVDKAERDNSHFSDGVQRFEAGTSQLGAIAGLKACLVFWQQQDRKGLQAYEQHLNDYLYQQLKQLCEKTKALVLVSQAENNIGIATLVSGDKKVSLSDLAHYLDEHDIAVRVGDHCAQPLWHSLAKAYQSDKGLRISLAAYNNVSQIDRLMTVINEFLQADEQQIAVGDGDQLDMDWQSLKESKSWQKRYKLLLQWGRSISSKPAIRREAFLVKGCEANAWLSHREDNGRHYFLIDSDANLIKGLAALLLLWFDGKTREEIEAVDIGQRFDELGLAKHLSPSRANGFNALLQRAKDYL